MVQILNASRTGDLTVSHSIFQIFPINESRLLAECGFDIVSKWAFERFIGSYELQEAHEANTFYRQLSTAPLAASLWGHIFEVKVLNIIDARGCYLPIHGLTSPGVFPFRWTRSVGRSNFLRGSDFIDEITTAIRDGVSSLHLVPSARNFTAVDSILYARNDVLTFIQATVTEKHPIRVTGLETLQSWLKPGTSLEHLRPSVSRPWRFIFIVPQGNMPTFKSQRLEGDDEGKWAGIVHQYVLGLEVIGKETK